MWPDRFTVAALALPLHKTCHYTLTGLGLTVVPMTEMIDEEITIVGCLEAVPGNVIRLISYRNHQRNSNMLARRNM
jgi:hypothetical protein